MVADLQGLQAFSVVLGVGAAARTPDTTPNTQKPDLKVVEQPAFRV